MRACVWECKEKSPRDGRCVGGWERWTKEAEKRDEEQRIASEDLIGWVGGGGCVCVCVWGG